MPNTGTRQAKRTPVTLKIKFKSVTLDQFIERYSVDVSHGGIFIRTKDPLAVGTSLKFEFQLKDATPLIRGEGTVVWTREHDATRAGVAPGMGVRFDRLPPESQEVLDQILTQKAAKGARTRAPGNSGQFGDQPTRVAPSPLVAGLKSASADAPGSDKLMGLAPDKGGFGGEGERTDATPLPTPMPFHSDADDFPEEAFEEKTRVAALNPLLVAATARDDDEADLFGGESDKQTALDAAKDEVAQKRAQKDETARVAAAEAKARADQDKADKAKAKAKADEDKATKAKADEDKAGKAKADEKKSTTAKADGKKSTTAKADKDKADKAAKADKDKRLAAAKDKKPTADKDKKAAAAVGAKEAPPEKRSSGSTFALAAAAIAILGVGGYVMFGMGGDKAKKNTQPVASDTNPDKSKTPPPAPDPVPEPAVDPTPDPVPEPAPDPVPEPAAEMVKVKLTATPGATLSLVGGDQSGAAPFTFEIEKGTSVEVRASKQGFVDQVVTIEGGKPAQRVNLVAKLRVVQIESTPAGASVTINGKKQPGVTPMDVTLAGPLARAPSIRIGVSKPGFLLGKATIVSASAQWDDQDDTMRHSVSVPLQERPAVVVKKDPPKKVDPVVIKKDPPKKVDPVVVKKDPPKKDDPVVVKKDDPPKKDDPVVVKKDPPKKDDPVAVKKDEPKKDEPKKDEGPTPDWMN